MVQENHNIRNKRKGLYQREARGSTETREKDYFADSRLELFDK